MDTKHFLTLLDFSADELKALIARAIELKKWLKQGKSHTPLLNKTLAMIFEKSSTRTRVSFETGMVQLGGHALFLSPRDTQFGRGEPIEDSARVLSRMVDSIMIRTFEHANVEKFAQHSNVPVINGLTDLYHPCQLLADIQTWWEHRGDIKGATVAWIGDGNNMCHSYMNAAKRFDFHLNIACPQQYSPNQDIAQQTKEHISISEDPLVAAKNADLIVTDVWASMGQEEEQNQRQEVFKNFQVNKALLKLANKDALFMHCLPAHRGEEVSAEIIDGTQSVVWDEAENRLHAQKALIETLLT